MTLTLQSISRANSTPHPTPHHHHQGQNQNAIWRSPSPYNNKLVHVDQFWPQNQQISLSMLQNGHNSRDALLRVCSTRIDTTTRQPSRAEPRQYKATQHTTGGTYKSGVRILPELRAFSCPLSLLSLIGLSLTGLSLTGPSLRPQPTPAVQSAILTRSGQNNLIAPPVVQARRGAPQTRSCLGRCGSRGRGRGSGPRGHRPSAGIGCSPRAFHEAGVANAHLRIARTHDDVAPS